MKRKKPQNLKFELDNPDQGLASPLDLNIVYHSPKSEMDLLPFLDLVMIGFLFFLLSSRLIYAPGFVVDMPTAAPESLKPVLVSEVLTVSRQGGNLTFFYQDRIFDFESIQAYAMQKKERIGVDSNEADSVLLIKMNKEFPIQLQADLVTVSKNLGYKKVQIAIEPEK